MLADSLSYLKYFNPSCSPYGSLQRNQLGCPSTERPEPGVCVQQGYVARFQLKCI